MRVTTVRFSDDLWQLLDAEASRQGVSVAQLVRDAAIIRIAALAARRGDREAVETIEDLAARSRARHRDREPDQAEAERLKALRATHLLEPGAEEAFDRLAKIAATVLNAPVALVSLVDENRQFFKACVGLREPWATTRETPLSHSFCRHAIRSRDPLVIEDARTHPQLRNNPAVTDLDIVAYLGIPLVTKEGYALGTLCVADEKPRAWTRDQVQLLKDLAASALSEIELHTRQAGSTPSRDSG